MASQVEAVVKQFAVNFLTAVNPQITKSWASGDRGYCYSLVAKGSKFAYLAILLFMVPIVAEADYLLRLWLGNVPAGAEFVRLSMAALLVDMGGTPCSPCSWPPARSDDIISPPAWVRCSACPPSGSPSVWAPAHSGRIYAL